MIKTIDLTTIKSILPKVNLINEIEKIAESFNNIVKLIK